MSELEVEQCVKMLELAGVVDYDKLDAWHKVFAKHKLSFEVVSMAMTHLTLVLPKYRKECFELFGFSPEASVFSDWVVRGRFDFNLARSHSWLQNGQLDYAYEGGDFLVMVDAVIEEKRCNEIWRYYHSKALMGPASATVLKLPLEEEVAIVEPVEEKTFCGDVDVEVRSQGEAEASVELQCVSPSVSGDGETQVELGDAVGEALYTSAFLLLYKEECREVVHEVCGFSPSLLSLVSVEAPMVALEELGTFRLVADGSTFKVGRNFSRSRDSCDILCVLSHVCKADAEVAKVRLKHDGVDYANVVSEASPDWLQSKYVRLVFEEPVLTVLHANGLSESHMGTGSVISGWLSAVEPSLRVGLQHAMEFQPGFESFLRMVGARFVDHGTEDFTGGKQKGGTFRYVVYVRYRGAGVDSILDAVWTGVETEDATGWKYPWFRRKVLGSMESDGERQLLQTRWVSAVDVPLGVRRGYPLDGRGCSFLKLAFSHDTGRAVNPRLMAVWDRVVQSRDRRMRVEKVDSLCDVVVPRNALVLVSTDNVARLLKKMLFEKGVVQNFAVSTVAEASGTSAEDVVVVDYGENLFRENVAACIVAVTRHTKRLQYVGVTMQGGLVREFVESASY